MTKIFNKGKKNEKRIEVELFPWEKLDKVDALRKEFNLSEKAATRKTAQLELV